ncbi:MAG: YggS family pyridoxal phosphate-dependent enzyme [Bacteriovoracaceae bacterium]|nr:YggS family pyridoxal phosphate-dependent enzyme [Bacteriovoracaceae bacterium]
MPSQKSRKQELAANLEKILNELVSAQLIAVSKNYPISDIQILYELGQRDFGENRVQELSEKAQELKVVCPDIRWHFIGKLQSNKLNQLAKVSNLVAIHSIDSLSLLQKIQTKIELKNLLLFLQVKTSDEAEKQGFENLEELKTAANDYAIFGLMTMGKIRTEDLAKDAVECFQKCRSIRNKIDKDLKLSMGMSQDYLIAQECESDYVRVGSSLFASKN